MTTDLNINNFDLYEDSMHVCTCRLSPGHEAVSYIGSHDHVLIIYNVYVDTDGC